MEKEYTVIANTREDLPALETDITASSGAGPIPNRSVDVANPRLGSKIQTHFMLTDEEAEELRSDPRVRGVEIPPEQRDDVSIGVRGRQYANFDKNVNNDTFVNWGLRRCVETTNVYSNGNSPPDDKYIYALDGTGVDVVIQDSGIDPLHPEWKSIHPEVIDTVTSSTNFGWLDLQLTSPDRYTTLTNDYSLTSNLFQDTNYTKYLNKPFTIKITDSNTGTTTELLKNFNGFMPGDGNEPVLGGFMILTSNGRIVIESINFDLTSIANQNGTIELSIPAGTSRLEEIDWYTASGITGTQSANHYRDADGHGTHCAGITAGKTYGWAKGSRIYSQKVSGLETLSGSDGTGISISNVFDTIRLWHNSKLDSRPTVVNMSWGYGFSTTTTPTGGTYRGTPWTYGSQTNTELWEDFGIVSPSALTRRLPSQIISVDAEIDDMITDGIHICLAAGNDFYKADVAAGADYDNFATFSGGNRFYHRPGSPYSTGAFFIGNINTGTIADGGNNLDSTAVSSKRGPAVNMWAPGTSIMSTTSRDRSTVYNSNAYTYPGDPAFEIMSIGGTSMASPQVCGVIALHLQQLPTATPQEILTRLIDDSYPTMYTTAINDDDYIGYSIMGSPNRVLFNRYNIDPVRIQGNTSILEFITMSTKV